MNAETKNLIRRTMPFAIGLSFVFLFVVPKVGVALRPDIWEMSPAILKEHADANPCVKQFIVASLERGATINKGMLRNYEESCQALERVDVGDQQRLLMGVKTK